MNNETRITEHAYLRMKQRMGLGKKACDRIVTKVRALGINTDNSYGKLKDYIHEQSIKYENNIEAVVYGEIVYIFKRELETLTLITVYLLPNQLKTISRVNMKRLAVN